MYQALPFTGAPLLYGVMALGFLISGSIARGIDYYKNNR